MEQERSCGRFRILRKGEDSTCIPVEADIKRHLTPKEKELAERVFKNSIIYDNVIIHKGEYLWYGLQNSRTAMTPEGEMYFPPEIYKDDFSISDNSDNIDNRHLFIHEMTHVWQYQRHYDVKYIGLKLHMKCKVKGCKPYNYMLDDTKKFCDYNLEQQGDIIADYFEYFLDDSPYTYLSESGKSYRNYTYLYPKVLSDFLAHPDNGQLNLPRVQ